jgi:hypothetical protein
MRSSLMLLAAGFGACAGLAWTAPAQVVEAGNLDCAGVIDGRQVRGSVAVELWSSGRKRATRAAAEKVLSSLQEGELAEAPGVVRLYGRFEGAPPGLRLEVYLGPQAAGVGSVWYRGRRDEERIMDLSLVPEGFEMRPRGGLPAVFDCRP